MSCTKGKELYLHWSRLLDQRRPKAGKLEISLARRAYLEHRDGCEECKNLNLTGLAPNPSPMNGKGEKEEER